MFKFIGDVILLLLGPKVATGKYLESRCLQRGTCYDLKRPFIDEEAPVSKETWDKVSSVAVLHGGTLFISSIIHPPGGWRNEDSWKADVEILLVGKDLKKVEFVGPTYDSVTGMINDMVKTYD